MTLYDINKQCYLSVPNMRDQEINDSMIKLIDHLKATCPAVSDNWNGTYYMLLCKEKSDYTVFRSDYTLNEASRIKAYEPDRSAEFVEEVFSIVQSRGKLKAMEINEDNTVNFWILKDDEIFMYKLFDYSWGVIEV